MKKRIRFIINPISGVGKKDQLPTLIEKFLNHTIFDYDIIYTEYRKHAKTIAFESSKEGFDIVCAVGGDGSVHEVGTALIGTQTKLAIIPAGSGNGLARHLKIPLKLIDAIKTINESRSILMDTGLVNDKPFLGIGGYGFDALIAEKFDHYHTRGFWGYTKLVMKEYLKYKPISIKIELPNYTRELPVVLCTVANASEFGNGFCVSPNSNVSDGTFELCILKPFSKWKTPFIIYKFFKRTSHLSKYAEIIPFQKARLILNERIAHYDGEPFEVRQELNIEVKQKSLNIIVGNNYKE